MKGFIKNLKRKALRKEPYPGRLPGVWISSRSLRIQVRTGMEVMPLPAL
jgi:hypothetical protein